MCVGTSTELAILAYLGDVWKSMIQIFCIVDFIIQRGETRGIRNLATIEIIKADGSRRMAACRRSLLSLVPTPEPRYSRGLISPLLFGP